MDTSNSNEYKPLSHGARNRLHLKWFRQNRFLEAYNRNKAHLTNAFKEVGMSSSTFYRWIRTDIDFNIRTCKIQQKHFDVPSD